MTRFPALALLLALILAAQAQNAALAAGKINPVPRLKSAVTVVGSLVRIGDLFEHAGSVADVAVFRAPGKSVGKRLLVCG